MYLFSQGGFKSQGGTALTRIAPWLCLTVALLLSLFSCRTEDLFFYLAFGHRIVTQHHLPTTDPFLFSLHGPESLTLSDWGSQVMAYVLYRLGGWTALELTKTAMIVLGASACLWLARSFRLRSFIPSALLLLGLGAGCDRFLEQASLVSQVLISWLLVVLCYDFLRPTRWIYALPVVFLLWFQFHAGALLGLVFLAIWALTNLQDYRRRFPVFLASTLIGVIHPLGFGQFLVPIKSFFGPEGRILASNYSEYASSFAPPFGHSWQLLFFCLLAIMVTLLTAKRFWDQKALFYFTSICLALIIYLGFWRNHFLTTAGFALPVLGTFVRMNWNRNGQTSEEPSSTWEHLGHLAVVLIAIGMCVKIALAGYTTPSSLVPRKISFGLNPGVAHLKKSADFVASLPLVGHVWNEQLFGGFLAWQWDGKPQFFFHGHVPDMTFFQNEYLAVAKSEAEVDRVISSYNIDLFFLEHRGVISEKSGPLYKVLLTRPDWKLVYWDGQVLIFLKDRTEYRALLKQIAYRYFDPIRLDRIRLGIRENPDRLREEMARVWQDSDRDTSIRALIKTQTGLELR